MNWSPIFENLYAIVEYVFTPFEYGEFIVLGRTPEVRKFFAKDVIYQDFLSPKVAKAMQLIDWMQRIFVSKYVRRFDSSSQFGLTTDIVSCTFNMKENCLNESRLVRNPIMKECLTFNENGNETVTSAMGSLEMILYMNASELSGTSSGTRAFTVVIHEPHKVDRVLGGKNIMLNFQWPTP